MTINKHQIFMNMTKELAKQSKCVSMQVGCMAVTDSHRIISTGVNGTPAKFHNCNDVHSERGVDHSAWSDKFEIHAEMNVILELARSSVRPSIIDFYTTHCPCSNCLKHMIGLIDNQTTVRNIIYSEVYYKTNSATLESQVEFCKMFNVNLISIENS